MAQLNLNLSRDFELNLKKFMKKRGIAHKSEAIRLAIAEGLKQLEGPKKTTNYHSWLGMAGHLKTPSKKIVDASWETKGKV